MNWRSEPWSPLLSWIRELTQIAKAELERLNYDDVGHLNNALKNMQQAMKRARKKEGEMEDDDEVRGCKKVISLN